MVITEAASVYMYSGEASTGKSMDDFSSFKVSSVTRNKAGKVRSYFSCINRKGVFAVFREILPESIATGTAVPHVVMPPSTGISLCAQRQAVRAVSGSPSSFAKPSPGSSSHRKPRYIPCVRPRPALHFSAITPQKICAADRGRSCHNKCRLLRQTFSKENNSP